MSDKIFVDTNILVYSRDSSEPDKQQIAEKWLTALWKSQKGKLSYQILNEYYVTVTKKLNPGLDPESARLDIKNLIAWEPVVIAQSVIENAWLIQDRFRFSWWDSLVVAAAQKSDCSILLSEDLQHQQQIDDVTIINPFITSLDSVLKS